jgi:hypothetical protein
VQCSGGGAPAFKAPLKRGRQGPGLPSIPCRPSGRFVRIPNTLHIRYVSLSEIFLDEALAHGNVEVVEYAAENEFDEKGYRARFGSEGEDQTVAAYPGGDDGYYGDA